MAWSRSSTELRSAGRSIAAYGAAAKGNTLLNFADVHIDLLPYVVDRNPHKQGLLLPGSHLPIRDPAALVDDRPDYVLILPWNLSDEITEQMSVVKSWGGRFVVAVPAVREVGVIFRDAGLPGAFLVDQERHVDERGWFARTYCADEFERGGLDPAIAQCSVSRNEKALHVAGHAHPARSARESKLVRCTERPRSSTSSSISARRPRRSGTGPAHESTLQKVERVYVPRGMAHGFLTLEPGSEVLYQISVPYEPTAASGVRWDDPDLAIVWPARPAVISERDAALPSLDDLPERAAVSPEGGDDRAAFEASASRDG